MFVTVCSEAHNLQSRFRVCHAWCMMQITIIHLSFETGSEISHTESYIGDVFLVMHLNYIEQKLIFIEF
jgi:hypothetical protein